jgi:hypothetical protein
VNDMTAIVIIIFAITAVGNCWAGQRAALSAAPEAQRSTNIPAARPQTIVRFSGTVLKAGSFERQIGVNLFFRLVPQELGWTISVGSKAGPENNFCGVVTPPYRGMNPIQVAGWHFRNSDNSGPNEVGPKNVNAPQTLREFNFVVNAADYQKAFDALQVLLWQYSYSKQQIDEAESVHAKLSKGRGRLTIRDLELNTLDLGKQAGIDRMTFHVELNFRR